MRPIKVMVGTLVLAAASGAFAADADSNLRAELEALKATVKNQSQEIQQLRTANGESWLTERRAEEVKTLIRDVLSDADTRASLAEGGMTAGWKDHFFLASEDGNFLLRLSGQVQSRYTYTHANERVGNSFVTQQGSDTVDFTKGDEEIAGFSIRRARVRFDGHLFDPRFTYAVQMNAAYANNEFSPDANSFGATPPDVAIYTDHPGGPDIGAGNSTGDILLEDAWMACEIADGWKIKFGQFKAPFLADEAVRSANQVAVERAFVTDLFTVDYTQGIGLCYGGELAGVPIRAAAMIHDGSYQSNTNFNSDTTDIALAARVEVLLAGEWSQFDDYQAWSGQPMALKIGAAVDYEEGEGGHSNADNAGSLGGGPFVGPEPNTLDVLKWTVDVAAEFPDMYGLSLFGAIVGQHLDGNGEPGADTGGAGLALPGVVDEADQWGVVLQASAFVVPDKADVFIRYEFVDLDGVVFFNARDTARNSGVTSNHIYYAVGDPLDDQVNVLTFGGNYYMKGNAAKASLDLVWVLDSMPVADSGAGLQTAGAGDQISIRAQFQFLF